MKKYLLFLITLVSMPVFGQTSSNYIKPIGKDGFSVDSILSMKGNTITYLRAGTEFDIEKTKVLYIEHSKLGHLDITDDNSASTTITTSISEPEFNGDAYICDFEKNTFLKMEKAIGQIKTKDQLWGPEMKLYVKPAKSPIRLNKGHVKVILRVPNINDDPYSFVKISKFSTGTTRKLSLGRQNELTGKITYGGHKDQEKSFDAKKYGESSVLLDFDIDEVGEYCISISNPNQIDGKLSVSCFGVDE